MFAHGVSTSVDHGRHTESERIGERSAVASRRQKKRKAKMKAHAPQRPADTRRRRSERPTPVQAVESKHMELAERLARRSDRFSHLLAKSFADERAGQRLITRGGLTAEEHQELVALRERAHAEFRDELVAATATLRELLRQGDPLHSVAVIQATNLMGTWGGYYEPTERGGENRVELVASLIASQAPRDNVEPLSDDRMQQVHDEIAHILDLLYLVNITNRRGDDPDADALRFTGAMHWMSIRGNSFGDHGRELAEAVFAPFDQWMLERYGFTIRDAIDVGDSVEAHWTKSINALLRRAGEFSGVFDYLGNRQALPRDVQKSVVTPADRENAARYAFIDVFRSHVRDATTFTLDELHVDQPDLDRDRVAAVLRELSIQVGGVDPSAYTGLFDPSPLVERPLLQHGDRYMLPVPGMLLRDIFTVFDARLLRERSGYSKSRAKTLDRLAVDWLSRMLPGAETYTNLHYGEDELDGLVLFEDMAFVVEGKGSAISFQARRGDVGRLVNEISRSVGEALEQGVRARDFILAPGDSVFFDDRGNEVLRLPEGTLREVQIVNPTIHELAGHAPQLARFRSRGLFHEGELPWSVYINDLRVIAETCENAAVFLHYLVWRARLPLGEQVIVADELDLWGAYLFGARFPPLDKNGFHHIANSTTDFDAYYDGLKGRGPQREVPRKFLEEPARSFVARMATERPPGWRKAAGVVLDLSIPELALVCAKAKEAGQAATVAQQFVEISFGRGVLIGVPKPTDREAVLQLTARERGDASFFVYVKQTGGKHGEIIWANYGKEISLELSDFEKRLNAAAPSAFRDGHGAAATKLDLG